MSTLPSLRRALDLQPGEGQMVGLLLLFAFCNGLVRTFTRSAAYALFLAEFSAQLLPLVYIGVSLLASLVSFAYLRLAQRIALTRLLLGTLGALILVFVALRAGLGAGLGSWLIFSLPIFYEILIVMTNLALWNAAGRLLNVQQGKRLFGLIGAGEPIAAVVGGFLTAPIVALIGTPNLLLLAGAAVLVALAAVQVLARTQAARLAEPAPPHVAGRAAAAPAAPRGRYVLLIFGVYTLAIMSYFFIDNIFYAQAQLQYADANELASFIGVFYAVVGIVWVLTNVFVIGTLFRRYGLRASLIVAPAALALSALALVLAGSAGAALALVFWLAALGKLLSRLSFDGLLKASLNILYQPLPAGQRVRVQTLNEGVIYAGAVGLTGLLLWALTRLLRLGSIELAGVLLAVTLCWLVLAVFLLRAYLRQIVQALARRALSGEGGQALADAESLAVLRQALRDPQPDVALYALRALAANDDQRLPALLRELLAHPAAAVRTAALAEIEQRGQAEAQSEVAALLEGDREPAVRGAAARTLAALQGGAALDALLPCLADPAPELRLGATAGLLRHGGIAGILAAGQQLLRWAAAPDPAERELAARVLGEVGIAHFDQPLSDLLADPSARVRSAAIVAAGRLASPRLWPLVLGALAQPSTAKVAASALSDGGAAVLPLLAARFGLAGRAEQAALAQIAGRIGGAGAIELLIEWSGHADPSVRSAVLRALARSGYRAPEPERPRIVGAVRAEVRLAAWALAGQIDLALDPDDLLQRALTAELAGARERVLDLLALIADRQAIGQARTALASASAEQRAYALELIEAQLPYDLKQLALPLLGDLPAPLRLQRLAALAPQAQLDQAGRLAELIADADGWLGGWTRACALHTVGALRLRELSRLVAAQQQSPDPLIAASARWALARLAPPEQGLPPTQLAAAAGTDQGAQSMLSQIEKTLILKTVGIFVETPDQVLAEVAALLDETDAPAGTTIFQKGDAGTSMYIIVDGQVRVHDGEHTLNYLHARDVFGEMALLDPEPRTASISAVSDTHLLRLDQEPFYELMDEHNQVARGIIRMLTRHLRARVRDLAELRAQIAAPE